LKKGYYLPQVRNLFNNKELRITLNGTSADVHQIIHNFIRPHWTTGVVPAVALGIMPNPLNLVDVLTMTNVI
jgi:hypothetical protein